jgi:hypothetical protein
MSSRFADPFPHAATFTSFPQLLNVAARGLLLSNFAAGVASVTITTVSNEQVTIPLGTTAVGNVPVYLPIQAAAINAATNVGAVTALWH